MKQPNIRNRSSSKTVERTAMNPFSIALFVLAALSGIGAGVMLVVHISQKTHANQREAELNNPPQNPPANYVAPTQTEVDELKAKAKGSFWTMVVLAVLAIAMVLVAIFIPTASAAPQIPAENENDAMLACTDEQLSYWLANNGALKDGADCQLPENGGKLSEKEWKADSEPVADPFAGFTPEQIAAACTQGLITDPAQYAALCGGGSNTGGPTNTTCTQGVMPVENGFSFTRDAVSCAWLKTAVVTSGGPTNTTCTQGVMPVENGFSFTWDAVSCAWLKTAVVTSGGPSIITATPGAPADNAVTYVQLNYDKNPFYQGDCMNDDSIAEDPKVAGQTHYPAFEICKANAAGATQAALEAAIIEIQAQAQATGAKTLVGNSITLPNESAWLVWIPNASTFDYALLPNDTAYPTGLVHPALGQIWIVPAYAAGVNGRTFQNADYELYAVAVK